ncbi:MAG TPA: hypothetical protein PK482_01410 [Spirochaetota bacterium]|jgi:hypothetical protein|nr:hypothetical protein [Spirochaetota bacterium]
MISRKSLIKSLLNKDSIFKLKKFIPLIDLAQYIEIEEDISPNELFYDAMKLGIDPSTLTLSQLKEILQDCYHEKNGNSVR